MMSREYLGAARALLRVAKEMTDQTIANRLRALAESCERPARKPGLAEAAGALVPVTAGRETAGWPYSREAAWIRRHGLAALEK